MNYFIAIKVSTILAQNSHQLSRPDHQARTHPSILSILQCDIPRLCIADHLIY